MDEPAAFSQAEGAKTGLRMRTETEIFSLRMHWFGFKYLKWTSDWNHKPERAYIAVSAFGIYLLWPLNRASHLHQPGCGWPDRAGCSQCCWQLHCETHWSHIYTWKILRIITQLFVSKRHIYILNRFFLKCQCKHAAKQTTGFKWDVHSRLDYQTGKAGNCLRAPDSQVPQKTQHYCVSVGLGGI